MEYARMESSIMMQMVMDHMISEWNRSRIVDLMEYVVQQFLTQDLMKVKMMGHGMVIIWKDAVGRITESALMVMV